MRFSRLQWVGLVAGSLTVISLFAAVQAFSKEAGRDPSCFGGQSIRAILSSGAVKCYTNPIRSVFNDGPVFVRRTDTSPVAIATLSLPPGKYLIIAKTTLNGGSDVLPINRSMECRLVAGGDFDIARATTTQTIPWSTMSLTVIHQFTASSSATLECGYLESGSNYKALLDTKVTAVQGGRLMNTAVTQ